MKLSIAAAALAMVLPALAAPAPADLDARTGGSSHEEICNNKGKQVCCTGLLDCIVTLNVCQDKAYCCKTDKPDNALVNISLLNCVSIL
ncbi:hypothetical protein N3K66_008951 [Trichothecium roseum]|uniref:Uncharacterized protein n=1 Tax=Trichothecium roseum TaxID=47278 RepID=A0ACC0UPM1_9HYPO|nr:hypothetical protein N3K66_008951 [Trichothecium roseum]